MQSASWKLASSAWAAPVVLEQAAAQHTRTTTAPAVISGKRDRKDRARPARKAEQERKREIKARVAKQVQEQRSARIAEQISSTEQRKMALDDAAAKQRTVAERWHAQRAHSEAKGQTPVISGPRSVESELKAQRKEVAAQEVARQLQRLQAKAAQPHSRCSLCGRTCTVSSDALQWCERCQTSRAVDPKWSPRTLPPCIAAAPSPSPSFAPAPSPAPSPAPATAVLWKPLLPPGALHPRVIAACKQISDAYDFDEFEVAELLQAKLNGIHGFQYTNSWWRNICDYCGCIQAPPSDSSYSTSSGAKHKCARYVGDLHDTYEQEPGDDPSHRAIKMRHREAMLSELEMWGVSTAEWVVKMGWHERLSRCAGCTELTCVSCQEYTGDGFCPFTGTAMVDSEAPSYMQQLPSGGLQSTMLAWKAIALYRDEQHSD